MFEQPWEGRAFGLAVELVDRLGLTWDDFRDELIAAIDADPGRPYWASWVLALERFVTARTDVDGDALSRLRARAAAYRCRDAALGDLEVFPLPPDARVLEPLLADLLAGWGDEVRVSVAVAGERRALAPAAAHDLVPDAASRCRHAELHRRLVDGAPAAWGLRLFDAGGDPFLTVVLPSPFADAEGRPLEAADWTRLECWDALRARHLGLDPDPVDRSGSGPAAPAPDG